MNDILLGATIVLDCIAVVYTIYIIRKNEELTNNNAHLEFLNREQERRNYSRQIEKKEIQNKLDLAEQEIKFLKEKLERYESNT